MRKLATSAPLALALAGCATTEAPPSAARQLLDEQCAAGNVEACSVVIGAEQAEAERNLRRRQIVAESLRTYGDSLSAPRQTQTSTCTPGYGGSVTCNSY